jgi:regulator of extracellular matrix RemA (YlzA/DUF370 family)
VYAKAHGFDIMVGVTLIDPDSDPTSRRVDDSKSDGRLHLKRQMTRTRAVAVNVLSRQLQPSGIQLAQWLSAYDPLGARRFFKGALVALCIS